MLNSVDEVIDALGGPTKVAALVAVGPSAVVNWRTRKEIPPDCFVLITDALAGLGKEAARSVFGFKEPAEARA
jgi:hypothetical protein